MATSKKAIYYLPLAESAGTAALQLSLDPDIYTAEVAAALGLDTALGSITDVIEATVYQAAKSSFGGLLAVTLYLGTDLASATNTRVINVISSKKKYPTAVAASTALETANLSVELGFAPSKVTWKIGKVVGALPKRKKSKPL